MKRGEVWVVNLNPNRGGEAGKLRPAVVLQNDRLTESGLPTIVVVPLTTRVRPALEPLRVELTARSRLRQDCHVMVDQPLALDRGHFGDGPLATLTAEEMARVERALQVVLGMY